MGLQIKGIVETTPTVSLNGIRGALEAVKTLPAVTPSKPTLWRYLTDNGIQRVKLARKHAIFPRNIPKRLEYATTALEWPVDFWDRVIWSDETTLRSMPQSKEVKIWTRHRRNSPELPVNPQIQHGGISVMFWGFFSKAGRGPLIPLDASLDSRGYVELLKEHLLPYIRTAKQEFGVDMILMQDNAPCHKAKIVTNFLVQNNVQTLDWPPQSPDLNPIENLWAITKQRRLKQFGVPTSRNAMIDQYSSVWADVEDDLIINLANSARRRLKEVVAMKGGHTSY